MKKYAFTFSVSQKFQEPIAHHSFLVRCMPGTYPFQRSYAHKLTIKPFASYDISTITTAQMLRWTVALALIPAVSILTAAIIVLIKRRRA